MDDSEILEKIYTQHFGLFLSIGLRYGLDYETAKEMIQDTFTKVWKNNHRIKKKNEASVRSYLITTYKRICISTLRRNNLFVEIKDSYNNQETYTRKEENVKDLQSDPLHEILLIEEMRLRKFAIKQLHSRYREPVRLFLEGKKPQDIAEINGGNRSTIRTQIERGLKKFEKILNKIDPLRKS